MSEPFGLTHLHLIYKRNLITFSQYKSLVCDLARLQCKASATLFLAAQLERTFRSSLSPEWNTWSSNGEFTISANCHS